MVIYAEEHQHHTTEWEPLPDVVGETESPTPQVSTSGRVYSLPPRVIPAGQSTLVDLLRRPRQVTIQNNTIFTIFRSYGGEASPDSLMIGPGQTRDDTVSNNTLWLYAKTAFMLGVNGGVIVEVYE